MPKLPKTKSNTSSALRALWRGDVIKAIPYDSSERIKPLTFAQRNILKNEARTSGNDVGYDLTQ